MIYAVEILDSRYVKIGFSDNEDVSCRIAALKTGNPFEIKPLFTTYGTLMQEQSLHAALNVAYGRIRVPIPPNEWYPGRHKLFSDFLEYLRYGPDVGLAFAERYNPAIKQPGKFPGAGDDLSPRFKWPVPSYLKPRYGDSGLESVVTPQSENGTFCRLD